MTEEDREAERLLMKREKSTGPRTDPFGTPRRTRTEQLFVISKNLASTPIRKERLSKEVTSNAINKARTEATQNKFVNKSGVSERESKAFE